MQHFLSIYDRAAKSLSGWWFESAALLLTRLALAGVFWRSGRTKVVDGSWLAIDDTQYFRFVEFGLPLPPEILVPVTTYAEFLLPILLLAGVLTRLSALVLVLINRGGGLLALDTLLLRARADRLGSGQLRSNT